MKPEYIVVRNKQLLKRIELAKLIAIVGDSYCSTFVLDNNEKFACARTLKYYETILPPPHMVKG